MKFSVSLPTGFEGVMYPIPFAGPEDFIAQGKLCERLGYDSVWGNDHITTQNYVRALFPGKPPNFYEPMMVLAAIGAVTTRLKLGTALTVLPMRDPVYLAKQAITLDQMSNGRFIMAVGLGAYREEFLAWGGSRVEKARRGDMMDEGLQALELNEMQERIATLKERAIEWGRDPDEIEIAPQFSVTIDKTLEAAEKRYMESGLVAHRVSLSYTGRDLSHQVVANLIGSPDVILEKIDKLRAIGVDHCSALMFPANSVAEMNEQVEWFATDVMTKVAVK